MLFGTLDSAGVRNNRQTELDFQGEEPEYNSSRMIVTFQAVDGNKSVPCAVGREDLEDHFNGNQKDPLAVSRVIADAIEHLAPGSICTEKLSQTAQS